MSTFAVTNSGDVLDSVNYLLSNLGTGNITGNISIPTGTLIANTATGEITQYNSGGNVYGYVNQYVNLRYATNSSGTTGFSEFPTNATYFGVYNSPTPTPSTNPAAYQWRAVSGGFGTTKTIYYSSIGGRQVLWAAASSPPSSNYVVSTANVAIDLDVVTTAAGTPGERGAIAQGYVVTTADPNTATSSQLTAWFEAARDNLTPPIGTGLTPVLGDTATFIYGAGTGTPSGTFTYNGSTWIAAAPQVVSGNVIVANTMPGSSIVSRSISGDRIGQNTIEGFNIAVDTITGDKVAANTITGNKITANTITANNIAVGTITGDRISANTITGNLIVAATITGDKIVGNTITGNLIAANTISASSIQANSITSTQISSAYIYAGNIVSQTASLGNTSSTGYWLRYTDGAARFGGNVSIGNNASIGGNLSVAGLVSAGALTSNTVATLTIVPSAVSAAAGITSTANAIVSSNQSSGVWTPLSGNVNISVVNASQNVIVSGGGELNASFTGTAFSPFYFFIRLRRYYNGDGLTTTLVTLRSPYYTPPASGTNYFQAIMPLPGYLDTIAGSAVPGLGYTYWFEVSWGGSGSSVIIRSAYNSAIAQALKR